MIDTRTFKFMKINDKVVATKFRLYLSLFFLTFIRLYSIYSRSKEGFYYWVSNLDKNYLTRIHGKLRFRGDIKNISNSTIAKK